MLIGLELTTQEFDILISEENADTERATGTALTETAMAHAGTHGSIHYPVADRTARASAFLDLCHYAPLRSTVAYFGDAQRPASAARQTGGKFAHANLMIGWWVGCMRLL